MYSVSVIVTAFNSSQYISKCLDTLIKQSLKNMQIIVVIDGSNDPKELEIVNMFKQKYTNFKVLVNLRNMGTGFSRERGVKEAQGEYIGFVDTDDFVEEDTYMTLYQTAKKANAEVAIADFFTIADDATYYDKNIISSNNTKVYTGKEILYFQLNRINKPYYLRVDWWNKIYKRELFIKNKIAFPHVVRNEGTMSMIMTGVAKKVVVIDKKLFHTVARLGSVCRTFKEKNIDDIIISTLHFKNWLKKINLYAEFEENFINFFYFVVFNHNMHLILRLDNDSRNKYLNVLINKIQKNSDVRIDFLKYLNLKHRSKERYVYATLNNNKKWPLLKLIKETSFFKRKEGGLRLSDRSQYNNNEIVSVVTIVKDLIKEKRKDHFEKMLQTVLHQTYGRKNIEHIVIDAASTDGTVEYLKQVAEKNQIEYWISETDSGIYNAMNKGPIHSLGKYIIYMNSDDYFELDALEKLVKAIQESNSDYAFGNAYKVNDYEKKVGKHIGNINKVYYGTPYCHQTLLCKLSCFERVKFDENFKITMWKYSLDLVKNGFKAVYLNEYIAYFRVGGVSTNSTHEVKFKTEQDCIKSDVIVPKISLSLNEYEYINHVIRHWNIDNFNLNNKVIYKKLVEMLKSENLFERQYAESTFELIEFISPKQGFKSKI